MKDQRQQIRYLGTYSSKDDAPRFAVLANEIPDKPSTEWIHTTRWLIQNNSFAVSTKSDGHAQFSLHATGEVFAQSIPFVQKSNVLDRSSDGFIGLLLGQ